MGVYSIWESRFPSLMIEEGRQATAAIWADMAHYDGYLSHILVEDLDEPGHLFVISEWESRAAADRVRDEYAGHENAKRVESLVAEPRRRILARELTC